jgi:hypothetical protein
LSDRPLPEEDVAAAVACARDLGLGRVEPQVLKLAHHTSVRLAPWPIVARVDSSFAVERIVPFMRRELAVAQHLEAKAAPAVRPTTDPPPGPHVHGRAAVTLWALIEHRAATGRADEAAAGVALRVLHKALGDYPGELPLFTDGVDTCARMLGDAAAVPALKTRDRAFLSERMAELRGSFVVDPSRIIPLHGDAHLGNVMITPGGAIWADLETACRGPLEWELTSLPPAGHRPFGPIDRALLERFSLLRSLTVAVWCWADADRSPDIREAAEYHLRRLRRRKVVRSATTG